MNQPNPVSTSRAHLTSARGIVTVLLAAIALSVLASLQTTPAHACACGCGVFEVGTASMFPTQRGGMASLEYDFMNQNGNWSGTSSAPAADNADQQIRTSFVTASAQYMFTRAWGVGVEVPYWDRLFRTTDDSGDIVAFTHGALGDVRVRGTFAGFSADLSTGVTAGLKLPTGDYKYANFDRDTEIGTGSTDFLLGAYHIGPLTADRKWTWFVDGQWDQPFTYSGEYHPGSEVDLTAAISHAGYHSGSVIVAPLLAVIGATRTRDSGADSNPGDSGYDRVLVAPGLDASLAGMRATLTVDVPLYEKVNGNQLVAPALFKLVVGHAF
jgi:hypothetical protein